MENTAIHFSNNVTMNPASEIVADLKSLEM
jgi:hypothetical protein